MKKKNTSNNGRLTPKQYLAQKAKDLPYHECCVNQNWQTAMMAQVLITKKQPSGKLVLGAFLIDLVEKGLKDCFFRLPLTEEEYEEFKLQVPEESKMLPIGLQLAHNLVYGGVDFAEDQGYQCPPDFAFLEHLLDEQYITDEIDDIEFGNWSLYEDISEEHNVEDATFEEILPDTPPSPDETLE